MYLRVMLVSAALGFAVGLHRGAETPRPGPPLAPVAPRATAAPDAASFTFAAGLDPLNQQAWLAAVGRARPEARALIDRVDGLVRVEDGAPSAGAVAVTITSGDGYTIRLRFGEVFRRLGRRGFDRVVHHELGHVVETALLDPELVQRLDAGIPPGQPCAPGTQHGSCAPQGERFAETFAKWAGRDIGVDVSAGYAVPPPPDLTAWGMPLAGLADR